MSAPVSMPDTPVEIADDTQAPDAHTRWNFAVISAESSSFQAGMAWADPGTVLPVFLGHLSGSTVLVGLIPFLQRAGYIVPQIFMAALLGHRPHRRPYLRWGVLLFRLPFLAFVLYLWLFGLARPDVVIAFMLAAYCLVSMGNGVVAVPWQDIIAKSIPAHVRGRFFGVMQLLTAVLAFGIGFGVRGILGPGGPAYPANYFVLFTLTGVFFTLSTIGCWMMREPIRAVLSRPETFWDVLSSVLPMLRCERGFRYLTLIASVGTGINMLTSFYTAYATRELHFAPQIVGLFISSQTIGAAAGSVVWAHCNDRRGPRAAIRGGALCLFLGPALAVVIPPLGLALGGATALPYLYALVFLAVGASTNGFWIGMNNYLYDLASHEERPRYIAILSTAAAPNAVVPVLAGVLLEYLPYPTVFAMAAGAGALILLLAWRMPKPTVEGSL